MAEVFGIVSGVLGLLPLCRDGLAMIRDVFDAPNSLSLAVGRLELQRDRFDEWREIWRNEEGEKDIKFEAYAKSNPAAARRVMRQLALLSQALFDARALEEQWGIKPDRSNRDSKDLSQFRLKSGQDLTIETQGSFLERCRVNMSFIKRCKFVFRKKETPWSQLIDLLKEYNENLLTYGPKLDLEKMLKGEFEMLRKLHLEDLKRLAEASAYEAKHSAPDNVNSVRYQDLSLAAQFSAVVKNIRSNSILFFPARNKPSSGSPGPASGYPQPLGYDDPIFVGLGNARVDDVVVDPGAVYEYPEMVDQMRMMSKRPNDINLDYYQHPDKRWNTSIRYSRAHDIYSLGCVLLEIGLWTPLDRLVEVEDEEFERTKKNFQGLTMKLDGMAGSIYGNVVRKCLAISTRERNEAESRELSKFCADIATSLSKCYA
ncbi:hypothetical protein LSUE1_G004934 [Lachnellula suecica]|uniref:Prion-inhibition and propagation HeLo domain-containing protein n=1 Tax=Lachnellula suecica TaxID=602035 RepID=A0A8T9C426_9HELO|nr:hypothetical protein LSUE1_G004934 [Lachnellula suecica]